MRRSTPVPIPVTTSDLEIIRDRLRKFTAERDWGRYHSPKNLAMALIAEAAELVEHFQWLSEAQSDTLGLEKLKAVEDELADVLLYLVCLADRLGIDLAGAAMAKITRNEVRYPADTVRGSAKKYTEY
jgi:dCTP diphosphatase